MGCKCNEGVEKLEIATRDYDINDIEQHNTIEDLDSKDIRLKFSKSAGIKNKKIYTPLTDDLKRVIQRKLNNIKSGFSISEISKQEFKSILNKNPFYKRIRKYLKKDLSHINNNKNIPYENIVPLKVIDNNGESQYYQGCFNEKGQCENYGIWTKNQKIYIGNFKNDLFDGIGVYINEKGDYYYGEWKKGKFNGNGQLIMNNIIIYEGQFQNSLKNGEGTENFPDGAIFNGNFENNNKNGKGKLIYSDGSVYEGNFKNSKIEGKGKIFWNDGKKYEGDFKDNKINGKGVYFYENGLKYEGNFVNNKKQGEGKYIWPDEMEFKGKFVNDLPVGDGMYQDKCDAIVEKISFKNGKILVQN